MASNQNIKDALSFPADIDNPILEGSKTVGNDALLRFAAALAGFYNLGRPATADDAARWLWRQAKGLVHRYERGIAEAALLPGDDLEG